MQQMSVDIERGPALDRRSIAQFQRSFGAAAFAGSPIGGSAETSTR